MKTCLFGQYDSASSIMFLQKAASHYTDLGYKVIWPLYAQMLYLKDFLITPAKFVDIDDPISFGDHDLVFDFQNAPDLHPDLPKMAAKYQITETNFDNWQKYLEFQRNPVKEKELFESLGLEGKKYTLIGRNYGSPPDLKQKEVYTEGDDEIIFLDFVEGYSSLDWAKVIENANQISIVYSSLAFLIEKLELKAEKKFLNVLDPDLNEVDFLFKTNWEFKYSE